MFKKNFASDQFLFSMLAHTVASLTKTPQKELIAKSHRLWLHFGLLLEDTYTRKINLSHLLNSEGVTTKVVFFLFYAIRF